MLRYLLPAVLVLSSIGFGQEPIKFRGAYIGEPLSDFLDCSHAKPSILREGYKARGKLCEGRKGSLYRMHGGLLTNREEGEVFMFENRSLFRILISIPNDDWEKIRYDLTEKLGEPKSEVPIVYQNALGARWEYNRGFWEKGETVAFAGIKVAHMGNQAINSPWSHQPQTEGIQITVTDAAHAKLPESTANSLD